MDEKTIKEIVDAIECSRYHGDKVHFPQEIMEAFDKEETPPTEIREILRVVFSMNAYELGRQADLTECISKSKLFEHLEILYPTANDFPEIFRSDGPTGWGEMIYGKTVVANWLSVIKGNRSLNRLVPYMSIMDGNYSGKIFSELVYDHHDAFTDDQTRMLLFFLNKGWLNDRSLDVLSRCKISESDIRIVEKKYIRDSYKQEKYVIDLYLHLEDHDLITLINRLVSARARKKRLAALEIVQECIKDNRLVDICNGILTEYRKRPNLSDFENKLLGIATPYDLLEQVDVNGIKNLFTLLSGLNGCSFYYREYRNSFNAQFNKRIKECLPEKGDTVLAFKKYSNLYKLSEDRLIKLAFFAPQWKEYIEYAIGWKGFVKAVDWISLGYWYASRAIDTENIDLKTNPRNNIYDNFNEMYFTLGKEKWEKLLSLFSKGPENFENVCSDIFLGRLSFDELINKINGINVYQCWSFWEKRRGYVGLLGIIPLPESNDGNKELLRRYQILQDMMRRAENKNDQGAVRFALSNLAKTAGFTSFDKFELAMATEAVIDLIEGPVTLDISEYRFSLSLNDRGEPVFESRKNGSLIRSIPEKLKDDDRIKVLKGRVKEIKKMTTRLRRYLEDAMCSAELFNLQDLQSLFTHPVLKVMMQQLVFSCRTTMEYQKNTKDEIHPVKMGYPINSGRAICSVTGQEIMIGEKDELLITHPCEMLKAETWHLWQHECFVNERIQPFKQIFREVYVVTDAEMNPLHSSQRFSGQKVDLRQAITLLQKRGWEYDFIPYDEFIVSKSFSYLYDGKTSDKACALIYLKTSGDMESDFGMMSGAYTAIIDHISVQTANQTIPLEEIPAELFSEMMRDVDLVVSVAFAGERNWEDAAPSIESRAALVRETCSLLKFGNVRVEEHFALIDGVLSSYKVHLGSGSIYQVPGNYVCVIPDRRRIEGKLFLPFVDKDEMTSIILSKIILLANDSNIRDPVILSQIKRKG